MSAGKGQKAPWLHNAVSKGENKVIRAGIIAVIDQLASTTVPFLIFDFKVSDLRRDTARLCLGLFLKDLFLGERSMCGNLKHFPHLSIKIYLRKASTKK